MADADIAIGLPEMTIDFNPGAGGTQRLPGWSGSGGRMAMMLEGRTLSPREALDYGLVQAVVPPEQVEEAAVRIGERLARRSPEAIRSLKRAVYEGASRAAGSRAGGGAEVVHGLLGHRVLEGEDGRDEKTGRGRRAIALGHVGVARCPGRRGPLLSRTAASLADPTR